jgi:hypothetical protein
MTLSGLGLGAAMCFSPMELYQLALSVGFPPGFTADQGNAGTMAAIAMRESNGCPDLHFTGPASNPNSEDSYGLFQINAMANPISRFGLTDPAQLYDPVTNAQAAFQMWGGNDNNLDVAWYTQHPEGRYRADYVANLTALTAIAGTTGVNVPGLGTGIVPVGGGTVDVLLSSGVFIAGLAVLGLIFFLNRE